MKTRIVLAGLVAMTMVLEVSAQRAEYDDMYFRGKDREKNKAVATEEATAYAKKQKQVSAQEALDADYYANPTDSYSARNVNPEYISRSNAEQASDDEAYYSEDYQPQTSSSNYNNAYYNNSFYNNANWARNSFYANSMWGRPYGMYGMGRMYGMGYYDPWMNPYGGFGYNDPWMMSSMYGMGMGYGYGWGSGWSMSIGFGNSWGWGSGYGNPYYGYGYGYPYYGGGYYEPGSYTRYAGRRPSRNSSIVTPNQRMVSRSTTTNRSTGRIASTNTNGTTRVRTRQAQDEYYVRPAQRTTRSTQSYYTPVNTNTTPGGATRSRGFSTPTRSSSPGWAPSSAPTRSSSPSFSPSRSSGGSSGGSGGGGGSRSRGRN